MLELKRALIFAKDLGLMTAFYRDTLGLRPIPQEGGSGWVEFSAGAARIALHAIPAGIANTITISTPPRPREDVPVKLVFAVGDVEAERLRLVERGVAMFEMRPWGACDGIDPEGNVFQLVKA
jgi:predicted enzyme related to lactoylglutathione lyase